MSSCSEVESGDPRDKRSPKTFCFSGGGAAMREDRYHGDPLKEFFFGGGQEFLSAPT